ncbi:hypothetical protein QBC42DRAFT_297141 [Cladorrhinum samala]|uniref:PhoD-like phosphatase domain-containing protein n=1 Tax=Cladorrhinum samala TaxID=585594 RepID=A0AAV9HR42_9PEZI|nr:hypothetical protein QBC42DRAFT_297141 [Cladorrhinum samala]
MSAPYWGQLPPVHTDQGANNRRQSLDTSHRVSVQTTKSDAPTESTFSPFASPTASSFQAQGLAPRPPSLPYGTNQYPPDTLEHRQRRRGHNQEQVEEDQEQEDQDYHFSDGAPPPAAPEVPRAPPSSYRYPPSAGGPAQPYSVPSPAAIARAQRRMDAEEYYKADTPASQKGNHPVLDRAQNSLGDSVLPRTRRTTTDPNTPRAGANTSQRRQSAAEQSLQRSARKPSNHERSRVAVPVDRSPLQRLEQTLDSISKEDKRARAEAAERAARESLGGNGAGQQDDRGLPAQPPFTSQPARRQRGASISSAEGSVTPSRPPPRSYGQNGPLSQNPPEESSHGQPGESRVPLPVSQTSGIPHRNLSFRERAAKNDIPLPNSFEDPVLNDTQSASMPPRSGNNKLKKNARPNDSWPSRVSVSDDDRTIRSAVEEVLEEDYFQQQPDKPQKSSGQRKVDQLLGRATSNTAVPRQAPPPYKGPLSATGAPVAAINVGHHHAARRENRSDSDSDDDDHHVSDMIYHGRDKFQPGQGIFQPTSYLDEWKTATVGTLSGALLDLEDVTPTGERGNHRGESSQQRTRTSSLASRPKRAEAFAGEYDDTNGTHTPNSQVFLYPNIAAIQSTDFQSLSDVASSLFREPQHLAPSRNGNRSKRRDGLRPFSPGPLGQSPSANDSQDSLGCFSIKSDGNPRHQVTYFSPTRFKPPLYLKCGPLLRYCGIRHERVPNRSARAGTATDREIWRGSIMIVTTDKDSSYDIAPTLRLFAQPIEVLPPPPHQINGDEPLAPEYVDPIAGHPKLGRKGETLYVRPVDHLEESLDVSRDETDSGLFEKTKSPPDVPLPEGVVDPPGSFAARRRRATTDGEKAGKYKDVRGFRLHAERGYTFWRFNIEIELREKQQRIAYRINRGPSTGFWVPARGQAMNIMFYSCNGFSMSVDSNQFSGPDPMWRDVLNVHQSQPFHVMIGGGDQIYNDRCMQETKLFGDWLMIKNPLHKHNAPFTPQMQDELEHFYLERYAMWFSQGLFAMANSQIPMVNMYDDHDIIDGFGSYPHHFMNSPVFSGLGNVAFKYYMLFQHQSVPAETEKTEPSWTLGCRPGPYITENSRSLFMFLGGKVALLAVDARTERTREEVIRDDTWKKIMDRCYGEIDKGKVEHLLVLLGVPIAYPRLVWLENILTSRVMDPVKALGKMGMFKGMLNKFDGGVEVLDDLDDHWTAKSHKHERSIVVEDLQDLAADKSIRVTILSGDVHLAAVGQFYSNPKLKLAKHKDFRYMPNIISSAIVNTPPPDLMADVLNKRNKVHHFDKETDEDMIPIFGHGVDGKPRNNKHLLPHRNWCAIRSYVPGHTPESTPHASSYDVSTPGGRPNIFRRLSGRARTSTFRGPDSVKDRSRPPISNNGFHSFSRGGVASSDNVGGGPRPSFQSQRSGSKLTRTLSGSSVSSRLGGLFRRRSKRGAAPPDDGGINGSWGPENDMDDGGVYDDPRGGAPRSGGGYAPQGSGLRGGLGGDYYPPPSTSEFSQGDENYFSVKPPGSQRDFRAGHPPPPPQRAVTYAPPAGGSRYSTDIQGGRNGSRTSFDSQLFMPKSFHRTATGFSMKQLKRRGTGMPQEMVVNLEGGLEVTFNVEISPRDPGGSTVPYRLVVPKLWYEYEGEDTGAGVGEQRNSGVVQTQGELEAQLGEESEEGEEDLAGRVVEREKRHGLRRLFSKRGNKSKASSIGGI